MHGAENSPGPTPAPPFELGDWRVDPASARLTLGEREVAIEPLLMDVLAYLARHHGEVISANRLVDDVWPVSIVADGAVYRAIAQLRRVLGDDARRPVYIETIPKRGYRLIAEVKRPAPSESAVSDADANAVAVAPPEDESRRGSAPAAAAAKRGAAPAALALIALIALAAVMSGALRPSAGPAMQTPVASGEVEAPSIAVLPFDNLSADEELTYFSDGLTEEILNSLAQIRHLHVVARTSSFSFREQPRDVRSIGSVLGAKHILEGSVRRSEETIRITAQLIDATTGYHLWSKTFDRSQGEILAMQREISEAVAGALEVEILETDPAPARPMRADLTMEVYEQFLLGVHNQRQVTPSALAKAEVHFERVIEQAPDYAPAYAALADNYSLLVQYNNEPLEVNGPKALALINKALSLDPKLALAHHARGLVHFYGGDYAAAISAFEYASQLAPYRPTHLVMLARALHYTDRNDEALGFIERAADLDPISPFVAVNRASILLALGRLDEAEQQARKCIDIAPDYLNGYWQLAWTLLIDNDPAGAVEQYELAISKGIRQPDIFAELAFAYLDLGRNDDALAAAGPAMRDSQDPGEGPILAFYLNDQLTATEFPRGNDSPISSGAQHESLSDGYAAFLLGDCNEAMRIYEANTRDDEDTAGIISPSSALALGISHELNLAECYLASGRELLAAERLAALREALPGAAARSRLAGHEYLLANAAALEGDETAALMHLQRAAHRGWLRYEQLVRERKLAKLGSDPEFLRIAERIRENARAARNRTDRAQLSTLHLKLAAPARP